jgi:thioredoxin-dependent peroxiredoxin
MARSRQSTTKSQTASAKAGVSPKDKTKAFGASGLEGKKAPDFTLPDQDGKPVSLKDLRQQGDVVLYFYPKDMTPGCTNEACSFRDKFDLFRGAGAQVVGVSPDTPASHRKFIEKYSLTFPLLSDSSNQITKAYGVYKLKSLYGRDFMGIERTTFIIGRDGSIRRVFPKVKVNGHAEEVLAALANRD